MGKRIMKKLSKIHTSMAFNMIGAVVLLLLVFGFFVYVVGYIS